jgi:hypothetical protein
MSGKPDIGKNALVVAHGALLTGLPAHGIVAAEDLLAIKDVT